MSRSEQMARIRSRDTRIELIVRRILWAKGFRYVVQGPLPGRPDMSFPGRRLAVFLDGCFWHGCQKHYRPPRTNAAYWQAKITRNRERDRVNTASLSALGWQTIRIWEHEVMTDPERVAARIERRLLLL